MGNPFRKIEFEKVSMDRKKKKKKCCGHHKNTRPPPSEDTIQQIIRKDKVMEIFRDMMVSREESLFSSQDTSGFVKMKFMIKMSLLKFNSLSMFINLRLIHGIRFLHAVLTKIDLAKKIFLLDLELGTEVLIPYELSQDYLPPSFRYYE